MQSAQCLCLASRQAARSITRAFDHKLRSHGIRATQFSVLTQLALRGELSVGALANFLGVERTTLTRNLELIEAKGWVKIQVGDEDARSRVVSITGKGRAAVQSAFAAWQEAQDAALAAIGPAGVKAMRALAQAGPH